MPQSFGCLHVHIVFSTKNRESLLTLDLTPELYPYIGGILRNTGSRLIEIGGIADHVHLLVSLGRQSCVADTVRDVKANSSRWIHEKFPQRAAFAWQAGYGAFAVSFSGVAAVGGYIQNQAEHHQGQSYQDEFRGFLRRHEIEWDERYVWD